MYTVVKNNVGAKTGVGILGQSKKGKATGGFTIIEVLIVLAIAGLIILMLFFALPALNRVERNRERKFDAGQVASFTRECLARTANSPTACDTMTEVGIDTSKLRLTNDVVYCGSGGNASETRCTDSYTHPSGAYPAIMLLSSYNNDTPWSISTEIPSMVVNYGKKCKPDVLHPTQSSPGKTDFVVTVTLEGARFPETICYAT